MTDLYEHILFLLFCHRCTDCQPGTTSSETALTCDPCPLATFSLLVGSPKCKDCNISEREYADGIGSTQCRVCSEGQFSTGSECQTCEAGQYQVTQGIFECAKCQAGQYQNRDGQLECKLCESGYFQREEGQTACIDEATIWAPILIVVLIILLISTCWYFRESLKKCCAGAMVRNGSARSGDLEMQGMHDNPMSRQKLLSAADIDILKKIVIKKRQARTSNGKGEFPRFVGDVGKLKTGGRQAAAGKLPTHMGYEGKEGNQLRGRMVNDDNGYEDAIQSEVENHPQRHQPLPWSQGLSLQNWFDYVYNEKTSELQFGYDDKGIRDFGRGSVTFKKFCRDGKKLGCELEDAEILALRLYTTKAYPLFTNPLREGAENSQTRTLTFKGKKLGLTLNPVTGDKASGHGLKIMKVKKDAPDETVNHLIFPGSIIEVINNKSCSGSRNKYKPYKDLLKQMQKFLAATEPLKLRLKVPATKHPMPMTVMFLQDGLKKLRVHAEKELVKETSLWRGFKNLLVQEEFLEKGGTELAPMSTTTNLEIAAGYSCHGAIGETALIMKLNIGKNDFMLYGAGLRWLSAFPGEDERLFPPLTYLKPTGKKQKEVVEGITFTIVEVVPQLN